MRATIAFGIGLACVTLFLLTGCEKKKPEPVKVTAPKGSDEVRAMVGREGGELGFADNGAKLIIPKGLLQEQVTISFKRVQPTFDLSGKDFVGKAYRVSPKLTFAPGAAELRVPVDKTLPGLVSDIHLQMYYYDKLHSEGPAGPSFVHSWQPLPMVKFLGFSQDQKYLRFSLSETISDRGTKNPFGLLQVGFDLQ